MGPIWDDLIEGHPGLDLFSYVIPSDLSNAKVTAQLEKTLDSSWNADSMYPQKSHWGCPRGYRNGDSILIFLTINPEHADNPSPPSLLPAAILTDVNFIY